MYKSNVPVHLSKGDERVHAKRGKKTRKNISATILQSEMRKRGELKTEIREKNKDKKTKKYVNLKLTTKKKQRPKGENPRFEKRQCLRVETPEENGGKKAQ